MNNINLYWWNSIPNFGDMLSPIIVEYLSGLKCKYSTNDKYKMISIGSILQQHPIFDDDIIWGSGARNEWKGLNYKKVDVKLIRGPKTRQILLQHNINCPEKYCDPGVLAPFIYKIDYNKQQKCDLLVVLHINTDCNIINFLIKNKIEYITLRNNKDIVGILDKISNSKVVISNSLHAIIVSECMGIPTGYLHLPKNDNSFKYYDYYLGSNRTLDDIKIIDWTKKYDVACITTIKKPEIDFKSLIETFPFKLKNENILNEIIDYYKPLDIIKQ